VLSEFGYAPDSVPAAGVKVLIRRNANLSTGGTATDVTEMVHPEIARRAVDAVRMVGLDIAGLDVIAKDIKPTAARAGRRGDRNQRGPWVADASGALEGHTATGRPRDCRYDVSRVAEQSHSDCGCHGRQRKNNDDAAAGSHRGLDGKKVGMACTDGVYFNGERIDDGDCSGPQSARSILMNPQVECAVLETARGGILREGLGFDRCDIAVVTNIGEGDHLDKVIFKRLSNCPRSNARLSKRWLRRAPRC